MGPFEALAVLPDAAAGALIRVSASQPARRWSYSLAVVAMAAAIGLSLALGPALAGHEVFALLLLPVLGLALGLGLGPALAAVALGVAGGSAAVGLAATDEGTAVLLTRTALFAVEAGLLAVVGALIRLTITRARVSPATHVSSQAVDSAANVRLIEPLTARELEVLRAAAAGRSASELAADLFVSTNTVKTHLAHCYDKLGAHNRAEAVALALQCGCLAAHEVEHAADALAAESPRGVTRTSATRPSVAG